MLKIGEFAHLGQVTVRTLRYYDQIGLLSPDHVDPWTGYRYYSRDQLAQLRRIMTLKDLGLSLEQIGSMIENDLAPAEVRGMLRLKEAELESQMRELETRLSMVRTWLGEIEKEKTMTTDTHTQIVLVNALDAFQRVEQEITHWQPRSWVQAQLVCMRAAGWKDIDYETLMTISGFGPSFSYHPQQLWWTQYIAPAGCNERIAQTTGFGYEWKHYKTAEEYWQALKETIDTGRPIHAPHVEEVVFVGYQDADDVAGRRVRPLAPHGVGVEAGVWWTWEEFAKWFANDSHGFLGRYTGKVDRASQSESATAVLEAIVKMAHDDPRVKNERWAEVKWGLEGLEAYAADVGDTSKSGKPDEYFYGGWMGCHAIYPQISGRASAAVYLKRLGESETFPKEVNTHLLAAAKEYHAARAAWGEYEKHLGNEETAEASDSWMVDEHRLAGAAAIRQTIEHEKAAIGQVQQALAAI